MEKFEEDKQTYEREISEHQKVIALLLEHMQQNMVRQGQLPSKNEVNNMTGDLNFVNNNYDNAETTYARLKVELE